ncbi:hypothetical protein BEL01nite_85380 [Bradyrhizobium elkanii]|nr:hypothetical protein BEL01nite_85380 [Bradyrhizobium elkanii]
MIPEKNPNELWRRVGARAGSAAGCLAVRAGGQGDAPNYEQNQRAHNRDESGPHIQI